MQRDFVSWQRRIATFELKQLEAAPILGILLAVVIIAFRLLLVAKAISKEHDRIKNHKHSPVLRKTGEVGFGFRTREEVLQRLKQEKLNLKAEKFLRRYPYYRVLWQVLPLLLLALYSVKFELKIPDSKLTNFFRPDTFENRLYRLDPRWRRKLRWSGQLSNGAYLFRNGTYVFENGTRVFYNNSVLRPNGILEQSINLSYFDIAETRSYLDGEKKEKHCGIRSEDLYESLGCPGGSGICKTTTPVVFPRDDTELKDVVRKIADSQCIIRPVGSRHSMGGLVARPFEGDTVAVSLARYLPKEPEWRLSSKFLKNSRVRMSSGQTLLDLYSLIRPKGYFLPSQPSSWAVSAGSLVSSMVYGGTFGKEALNTYVTGIKVMLANGTMVEIWDEERLKLWRGSMGLLGIITGVEFAVEKRPNYIMGSRTSSIMHWNPWVLDEVLAGLLPGSLGGHYLLDPWTDEILGIGYVNTRTKSRYGGSVPTKDSDCVFSPIRLRCVDDDFCHFSPRVGDFLPSHSCRLKEHLRKTYDHASTATHYKAISTNYREEIATKGMPGVLASKRQLRNVFERVTDWLPETWFSGNQNHSLTSTAKMMFHWSKAGPNDGFWELGAERMAKMTYAIPVECLFEALDTYRQVARELFHTSSKISLLETPLMLSFTKSSPSNIVLHPTAPEGADFAVLEIKCRMKESGGWQEVLALLEAKFHSLKCSEYQPYPITSSLFAFAAKHSPSPGDVDNQEERLNAHRKSAEFGSFNFQADSSPLDQEYETWDTSEGVNFSYPFSNRSFLQRIFPPKAQEKFLSYRDLVDPGSNFWGGLGTKFFNLSMLTETKSQNTANSGIFGGFFAQ